MSLLNNNCFTIKMKAISILYIYFSDFEQRNISILTVLLKNKNNFEIYLNRISLQIKEQAKFNEYSEKMSFILYQLVRLDNYF